jgi:hypothetical protein
LLQYARQRDVDRVARSIDEAVDLADVRFGAQPEVPCRDGREPIVQDVPLRGRQSYVGPDRCDGLSQMNRLPGFDRDSGTAGVDAVHVGASDAVRRADRQAVQVGKCNRTRNRGRKRANLVRLAQLKCPGARQGEGRGQNGRPHELLGSGGGIQQYVMP